MSKSIKSSVAHLGAFAAIGLACAACPATLDDRCAEGACAPRTDASGSNPASSGDASVPTDPCLADPTAASCMDETKALFVAPNGNDTDPQGGTRARPLRTVTVALAKVDSNRRRVYVCDGTYLEDLKLGVDKSGISIFGGVDCTTWHSKNAKPVIGASATPLQITDATGVALANLAVVAKEALVGSSIAAFVSKAEVTFKNVDLTAGNGAKGAKGELKPYTYRPQSDLNGHSAAEGAGEVSITCEDGSVTVGGKGGKSGFDGDNGQPKVLDNGGTLTAGSCQGKSTGGDGAPGSAGANATGAARYGKLDETGWQPTAGDNGLAGSPGQGGGGGAGYHGDSGGGGAGGCGGAGGGGGKGGGASIALVSYRAQVTVTGGNLQTSTAGSGGDGSAGQQGQQIGGYKGGSTVACSGGNGGIGGDGGAGGGGAGGISVGILFSGPEPALTGATVHPGNAGGGGKGGAVDNRGQDGTSAQKLPLN